jgi:hypothetical protein
VLASSFGTIANSRRSDSWIYRDDSNTSDPHSSDFEPVTGNTVSYSSGSKLLFKIGKDGQVIWQKQLSLQGEFIRKLKILADGSIILAGIRDTIFDYNFLIKLNSEGNVLWSRQYLIGYESSSFDFDFDSDMSGTNAYFGFTRRYDTGDPNTAPFVGTLLKINTTDGSVIWGREFLGPSGIRTYINKLRVASNGEVFVSGYDMINAEFEFRGFVSRIGTSGSMIWQRVMSRNDIGSPSEYLQLDGLSIDDLDNIYVSGIYRYSLSPTWGIAPYYAKFSSSGTLQHHYSVLSSTVSSQDYPVQMLGFDNYRQGSSTYLLGRGYLNKDVSSQTYGYVIKITDTTIDYARQIYTTAPTFVYGSINGFLADDTHFYFSSSVFFNGEYRNGIFKFPQDGSKMGRYEVREMIATYEDVSAQLASPPISVTAGNISFSGLSETITANLNVSEITPTTSVANFNSYLRRV